MCVCGDGMHDDDGWEQRKARLGKHGLRDGWGHADRYTTIGQTWRETGMGTDMNESAGRERGKITLEVYDLDFLYS